MGSRAPPNTMARETTPRGARLHNEEYMEEQLRAILRSLDVGSEPPSPPQPSHSRQETAESEIGGGTVTKHIAI